MIKTTKMNKKEWITLNYITPIMFDWGGSSWGDDFFLDDKTSAPEVFCSCSFILRAHFETSLLMVKYYGYEI